MRKAAVDLCISERLIYQLFPLDPALVRKSDGAQLVDEAKMADFIYRWFTSPNKRDFQYRWCSDCRRWFHRSLMAHVPAADGVGNGQVFCPECAPRNGTGNVPCGA